MGSSTYVSSLKERESAEAQDDIDELQAQYGATLAERIATSLQAYEQMRLNAQQYNLQAQAAAQQAALNLAGSWYSDYVARTPWPSFRQNPTKAPLPAAGVPPVPAPGPRRPAAYPQTTI